MNVQMNSSFRFIPFILLMQESRTLHYVLGAALVMVAVFTVGSLVMLNSQADSATSTASITNVAPSVSSVFVNSTSGVASDTSAYVDAAVGVDLASGASTKVIYINGIVHDDNGRGNIAGVSALVWEQSNAACNPGATDIVDCYAIASCDMTAATSALENNYVCTLTLASSALSTSSASGSTQPSDTWKAIVTVDDTATQIDSTVKNFEVGANMALNIPAAVAYGARSLGSSTMGADNVAMTIGQFGNVRADVTVHASSGADDANSMSCTIGKIAATAQKWSTADGNYGTGDTALPYGVGAAVDTNLNVLARAHGDVAAPSRELYWGIQIPASGVSGSCTGTTVISALVAA